VNAPARGIHIGLAGWSEAVGRHRASFPTAFDPTATALAKYATAFGFVEINASFYRQFRAETYAKWADDVPESFRFSVKMHRLITHYTRLKNAALLEPFFESIAGLGKKLAVVLVQLPPSLIFEPAAARTFFDALRARHAGPVACEPRHESWRLKEASALLSDHHIGLVRIDIPTAEREAGGNDAPIYVRLHGAPRRYYSSYASEQLMQLAEFLRLNPSRRRFVVFDNTASSAAVRNGLELTHLLGDEAAWP
jgi:uncharacterized protein YecE (DUF72 family)